MKVGILTFHRAINFGAVLQAYALQEVLSSLGQEVRVINYMQPRVENTDRRKFKDTDKLDLLKGFHLRPVRVEIVVARQEAAHVAAVAEEA